MDSHQSTNIIVGVSSCLMGEPVRFDAGHKKNRFVHDVLSRYFQLESFCPEVDIGLGTPREPIHLVLQEAGVKCVGTRNADRDFTRQLEASADRQADWHRTLSGYILKKDSPSCGMERVKVYSGGVPARTGTGIYAKTMMKNFPCLPVEEEGRLDDVRIRENFVQQVYVYARWRALCASGLSLAKLQQFHASHKYLLMSHNALLTKELGGIVAKAGKTDVQRVAETYIRKMTRVLKIVATRKGHTNTLQHLQGYLKNTLSAEDKQELTDSIQQYRKGYLPLIAPLTLLRHHFRRSPHSYISQSHYMQPHPDELNLLNQL
ncbi:MAG: hypothetical protein CSA52_02825 [Gammaproteobacteria bacterium]|nr:MAG: hypothetical protein CSB48_04495 [Pseudomonadota bacterium]PIE38358.1 MAG: hypothetical protein CSA52_02825 [Gammaproteobacteria bacterium]